MTDKPTEPKSNAGRPKAPKCKSCAERRETVKGDICPTRNMTIGSRIITDCSKYRRGEAKANKDHVCNTCQHLKPDAPKGPVCPERRMSLSGRTIKGCSKYKKAK